MYQNHLFSLPDEEYEEVVLFTGRKIYEPVDHQNTIEFLGLHLDDDDFPHIDIQQTKEAKKKAVFPLNLHSASSTVSFSSIWSPNPAEAPVDSSGQDWDFANWMNMKEMEPK